MTKGLFCAIIDIYRAREINLFTIIFKNMVRENGLLKTSEGTMETEESVKRWREKSNEGALREIGLEDLKDVASANPDSKKAQKLVTQKEVLEGGQAETMREYLTSFAKEGISADEIDELAREALEEFKRVASSNRLELIRLAQDGEGKEKLKKGLATLEIDWDQFNQNCNPGDPDKFDEDLKSPLEISYNFNYVNKDGGISSVTLVPSQIKEVMERIPSDLVTSYEEEKNSMSEMPADRRKGASMYMFVSKAEELRDEATRIMVDLLRGDKKPEERTGSNSFIVKEPINKNTRLRGEELRDYQEWSDSVKLIRELVSFKAQLSNEKEKAAQTVADEENFDF